MKKTSTFANGLIWFGAAISIAEILTGTILAPLGFQKAVLAIIIGHLIGAVLMYFAGIIGAHTERSSMDTVKLSFGERGSYLFSSLNVLQLVGWTAVMIYSGAIAASTILPGINRSVWSLVIGGLILVWIFIGLSNLGHISTITMGALFILTLVLSGVIFGGDVASVQGTSEMSFGSAVELSVAMPLSWLVLIADYTKDAEKKQKATITSVAVYFAGSCWMYIIGMGAALFTGESDVAQIMLSAGLGIVGLIIIVLSTVTTTFLDAYSAGISALSISGKISSKWTAVVVTVIGTALAIITNVTQFEGFLYLIGSVFAPMIAILITDYFILHRDYSDKDIAWRNMGLWVVGFILYRVCMSFETVFGNTLPVMVVIMILAIAIEKLFGGKSK
ncbi:MAG: putative hydroxymethylpyrimidine transporter CytX [Lachnospiraceae bacterium]